MRIEYGHLQSTGSALRRATGGAIAAPEAILATRRVLITELCDATPLSKLARDRLDGVHHVPPAAMAAGSSAETGGRLNSPLAARAMRASVRDLHDAFGRMVLCTDTFHADPHPGNLLVPNNYGRAAALAAARRAVPPPLRWLLPPAPPRLYLVDWGQCGGPTTVARRTQLAQLYLELARADESHFSSQPACAKRVAFALRELGVVASAKPGRDDDVEQAELARGMFDLTGEIELHEGVEFDNGSIDLIPRDLFLVLRVTQMLSGLANAAEKAGSAKVGRLAHAWKPHAKRAMDCA